jgi:7-cyano-7-deazaguanine tRNA-ribosyltransferase
VKYHEEIGTDIATILDIPTGWKVTRNDAEKTVKETLKRAEESLTLKAREDLLWVGPVQGGKYLDLVAQSARRMGKLPFQIHALGSPTEVMERYRFDVLVGMIMTAKMNLPINRPLHLFGAGHPFMFAMAVALGCDLFDSAAYALYAKEGRYMTETGTNRIGELEYFPCNCPKCATTTPMKVLEMPPREIEIFLSEHNLYVCSAEIRRIRQSIRHGRLWELVQQRAQSHPSLHSALNKINKYEEFIEKYSPSVKSRGMFFFGKNDLSRPEIVRYEGKLKKDFSRPRRAKTLLLLPQTQSKPFSKSFRYRRVARILRKSGVSQDLHTCFYSAPFGIVPIELDEIYPLSQHETSTTVDAETMQHLKLQVARFITRTNYQSVVFFPNSQEWKDDMSDALQKTCKKKNCVFKTVKSLKQLEIAVKRVQKQD